MALSALLLLLPLLLNVQNIPDESVQSDMKAVYSAISSPEQWKDSQNSLASLESQLTEPQRALAKMHWELETIQKEKPEVPPQFDLGLFSEALEVMVEMDEEAKAVKLRKDKLIEWAGGEEAKKLKEKMMEEKTVPEVKVNENGQIDVKNGAGGDERMEVRRTKDEKGREQMVITLVKRGGTEEPVEGKAEKPQENAKTEEVVQKKKEDKNTRQGEEDAKMEQDNSGVMPKTDPANSHKPVMTEEAKNTEQNKVREVPKMDSTHSPKSVVPMRTILSSPAPSVEEEGKAMDELTEEANGRKKAQNNEEMLLVATENNGRMRNANNGGIFDFVRKFISNVFGRKKRDTENMTGERRKNRSLENLSNVWKSDSEPKSEDKQQQDEKQKAEIKQYLEKGVANTGGTKKAEKLAYAWYSELLYWTTKWIEALEKRMAGVNPELAQQFLFSKTGLAAYQELKEEVDKCEAKLAKLKEWIGDSFK
ncbi:hypothetical protein niasHT_027878 [Heterodera trifolii]|uniref:Uncharacterized protein n=1 Tax=Heterodera trifolii TaxID=157864 RepID=A0ABD2KJY9_9BILA